MRSLKILFATLVLSGFATAIAADTAHQQKFVDSAIEPQKFVEKASSGGVMEVELAKMALEKSTLDEVRHFAQMMIESHTVINDQLRTLAKNEGLNIADEPSLVKKTKAFVLSQKEGESFDEAYAKNQVAAHEKTYHLFRRAANSSNDNIRKFAETKLTTLEHHLNMARALATTVAQSRSIENAPKGIYTHP